MFLYELGNRELSLKRWFKRSIFTSLKGKVCFVNNTFY